MKSITLKGLCSTCSVMDWIEQNGCPALNAQFFEFPDAINRGHDCIVVSSVRFDAPQLRPVLMNHPVESWHQVTPTQLRLNCDGLGWYACIDGSYYWMTT